VEKNELGFGKAFGAACTYEIRAESFKKAGPDEAGTYTDEGKS
jgi:hypothetical protein